MRQYFTQFSLILFLAFIVNTLDAQVVRVVNNRVGINTNSPAYKLHVAGGDIYTRWFRTAGQRGLYSQSYGTYLQAINGNYWALRSDRGLIIRNKAGQTRGWIYHDNASAFGLLDKDGNWGLRLQNDSYTQFAINNNVKMTLYSNGRLNVNGGPDASGAANTGGFQLQGTLRMDGNEIITNTNSTLHLQHDNNGDLKVDNGTFLVDASNNTIKAPFMYDSNNNSYYVDPSFVSRMNYVYPRADNVGYVGSSGSTWGYGYFNRLYRTFEYTLSDRRTKENIREIDGALEKVMALDGKLYNYKASVVEGNDMTNFDREEKVEEVSSELVNTNLEEVNHQVAEGEETPDAVDGISVVADEKILEQAEFTIDSDKADVSNNSARSSKIQDSYGFIAQEVQKIIPEAVDYDEEKDVYSMSYSSIIPILVEGMKEQQVQIQAQQKQIDELKKLIEQK